MHGVCMHSWHARLLVQHLLLNARLVDHIAHGSLAIGRHYTAALSA